MTTSPVVPPGPVGRDTSRAVFAEMFHSMRVVPVQRVLFHDGESPVSMYSRLTDVDTGTFLLESAEHSGGHARWSFIGVDSYGIISDVGEGAEWIPAKSSELTLERLIPGGFVQNTLGAIEAVVARWATPPRDDFPPLHSGLVGLIGWSAIRHIETLTAGPPEDFEAPITAMVFIRDLIALDHRTGHVHLITSELTDTQSAASAWSNAQERLNHLEALLRRPITPEIRPALVESEPEFDRRTEKTEFVGAVERAKSYIRDGDVFQVVIAQRFDIALQATPLEVYRVLRAMNPSPYLYLLEFPGNEAPYAVVGSSPEALVRVQNGRVSTRPIAGSRPRGADSESDLRLEAELRDDPKERAEHVMLVDLARNDLAKVCQPGSVEVVDFMRIERYSHIMHLVSAVEGNLAADTNVVAVIRSTFPAGTLSGAPKPRALEIIDELEPAARGLYGGVVGYLDWAGNADLAIAIRTAFISSGVARVGAGAGIVADSEPENEDAEALTKAKAMLRAVWLANQQAQGHGSESESYA